MEALPQELGRSQAIFSELVVGRIFHPCSTDPDRGTICMETEAASYKNPPQLNVINVIKLHRW